VPSAESVNFHLLKIDKKTEFFGNSGGVAQPVGATLVVTLDWAGTRPAPTYANTSGNPKEPKIVDKVMIVDY
jgi:hypothetical protein